LLALGVVCVAGFFLVRLLNDDSPTVVLPSFITQTPSATAADLPTQPPASPSASSTPGQGQLTLNPQQGYVNTLVTVTGSGWWPDEAVFIFLRSQEEGDGRGYAYAAAVADENGAVRTALTFPNEVRWLGQPWADVIARGSRSGLEISIRFVLVAPTATNTPLPPTPRPTRTATAIPEPTDTPPPTDTPFPTATPTPELVITDWLGQYFANTAVAGDPVLVRNDTAVDFNWGAGSPGEGVPLDGFSARWTRQQELADGTYHFEIFADDGVRFWIDGKLYVDEWHDSTQDTYSFDAAFTSGSHALQVEFYENVGGAMIQLKWDRVVPPTATPQPTATPSPADSWQGEYYATQGLRGDPVLVRYDADLNFDWGKGSPAPEVPADSFSVRWTIDAWMPAGTYRVYLDVNEGARYWLDGQLLIDEWHKSTGETYVVEITVQEGIHSSRVEYYEGAGKAWIRLWAHKVQ
jgi:hypothetical protein